MSVLFSLILTIVLTINSSFQSEPKLDDDDGDELLQKIRDSFSEFLQNPVEEHPVKRIRDISKIDGQSKTRMEMGKPTFGGDIRRLELRPLYPCNYFDSTSRMCVNVRQLGTTLTIGAVVEGMDAAKHPIQWYRVYKVRGQSEKKSLNFVKFSRENLPWNINLGGSNNELRISPIMETDFSYNFFLATLDKGNPKNVQGNDKDHLQLMMFSIEPISINMGTLYHGEEIIIDLHSHMELPAQSVQYEWSRIGPYFEPTQNLPSNMKFSRDGSALIIKEHRNYGDMILTCAVYSNKNVTLGRRNFLLEKLASPENPNPTAVKRKRRYLEKFYDQPWNVEHIFKYKRDSSQKESTDSYADFETQTLEYDLNPEPNQNPMVEDLSEISSSQQSTSRFSITDNPKKTILNFYGNTPFENMFQTESEMNNQEKQPSSPVKDFIDQANSMVLSSDSDKVEQDYPSSKIIEEKPTFEDKESMLIADCNVDADCGINAVCFHVERTQKFCKCLPHYRGNGLFCWLF